MPSSIANSMNAKTDTMLIVPLSSRCNRAAKRGRPVSASARPSAAPVGADLRGVDIIHRRLFALDHQRRGGCKGVGIKIAILLNRGSYLVGAAVGNGGVARIHR